jgi:hypothetical protein
VGFSEGAAEGEFVAVGSSEGTTEGSYDVLRAALTEGPVEGEFEGP